jgi:signal transduction histidine kinase/ABC-type nitrate/sulfonate/bicarbonate transport system substrate-binding protein
LTLGFVFLLFFNSQLLGNELKKVTLQLSWFDQFQFAGYYMAKEKGFYKALGLDVEIKPFEFGIDIPNEVSRGTFDFAVGRETLILDRTKNRDIVALYALFQATPLVLLSTKESGIHSVNDFSSKRVMTTIDDASEVSLKAMISSHNVRLDELTFLKHSHDIHDLINKKTDVISAYISKSPYDLNQLGVPYNVFDPKAFGFDMYSDFLYTSNTLIANDVKTVRLFKEASLKGWEYAYANIEESAKLIVKKYNTQNLTLEALMYEGEELKKLSFFNTNELGSIKHEKLQRIYDLYNVMGLVSHQIKIDDFLVSDAVLNTLELNTQEINYLKEHKTIKMCVIPNLMPYSEIKNNTVNGFVGEYIKLIEEQLHIQFELVKTYTMAQTLEYLKENKCQVLPTAQMSETRKEFLMFSKEFINIPFVLVTQNSQPFFSDISSLKNKSIVLIKGYALTELLKTTYPSFNFLEVDDLDQAFQKVSKNEAYGAISPLATALYKLQKNKMNDLKISGKLNEENNLRFSVVNDEPILFSILNKTINSFDESKINQLLNKWMYVQYEKEFDYGLLWKILVIFACIVLAVLYRQRLLRDMNVLLTKTVEDKTKELIAINAQLEDKIKYEVEKNLKKDRMLARQAKMASMGEMLENIAHQWRQPLSIITTASSGLRLQKEMNTLNDEMFEETMETIIKTSTYLSSTIDDFRYFFKPQKQKEEFEIKHAINKSLDLISSNLKEVEVIKHIETLKIYGFENELIQVFINIFNNAKDAFRNNHTSKKLIFIDIYKKHDDLVIRIKDNAGGVPEDIINKISEPYFTTKHKSQGTGIGLYMCEEILKKHMNASLEIQNVEYEHLGEYYKGACFTIVMRKVYV